MEDEGRTWFLQSERVALRSFEVDDELFVQKWINDPDVTHFMFYGQKPMSLRGAQAFIDNHTENPENVVFMFLSRETGNPIGFGGIYGIHRTAHRAEFRILIGEKSHWGQGIGTEITQLLTFYGFDRLNLHRIWLGVTSENKGAIRAYEKAGYVHEGVLRQDIFRNGVYYDSVRMGILREEYEERFQKEFRKRFK
ncbi:MAG: GNAT family N-acetyltransferase [Candidatus Harrisonbacteria bacterium CG10_big_fil_rev_8_21_14_0_10_42_17]|uniref:GNAT family N-acetyltransferase n=1 Tax=Candidatus Harrisonbacteria bacterium CG10_big_fil_rev_8_21_14_0_10_42_17 TaxID=1974584 RepID=A0A2M6WIE6_9BACT|nr:MAG: GNAT family N-acetyltransferase [Candidatus Harrisonbacteria bacterium CG10_big_fil_rev_8_21_14_0_10_42_17]